MELELQGWKVKLALVALAVVVVAAPLARAVEANKGRAEDWHRRAIVAEESVTGLRLVIEERSRALNQRTIQANRLLGELDSNRASLQRSKVSFGTLTRKQARLAEQNAQAETQRRTLQKRLATLEPIARKLGACGKSLPVAPGASSRKSAAVARARLASCAQASASLDSYLEQGP
jgi:hypothetical protein